MGKTKFTAIDARTISINGSPAFGSAATTRRKTKFKDTLYTDAVLLNGVVVAGALPSDVTPTKFRDVDFKSLAQAGTPTPTPGTWQLPANFKMIDMGDSLRAAGRDGDNTLTYASTTNFGGAELTRTRYPFFAYDIYPADTSSIETGYGATEYTWGANLGYAGSPIDYVISILPRALFMTPDAIYWGPTINSVLDAGIVAKINTLVSSILAAGKKLFLRTLPPVVQGSTFDTAGYPAAYATINATVRALAAANPNQIALVDLDPAMCIGSTVYRKAGQTWDGTHNNEAGAAAEMTVLGPVLEQHVAPGTNVIRSARLAATSILPNSDMGGYAGSRSGVVAYAGPGLSVPSLYSISNSVTPTSTATAGVESDPTRGGFTALGYSSGTTLTIVETTGVLGANKRLAGPGITADQMINGAGAGGGVGTYPLSISSSAGGVRTSSITANVLTVSSGTGISVGQIARFTGQADRTILSGSGTTWTVSNGPDIASASMTVLVPLNVGAQRMKITVTPAGALTEESVQITLNPLTLATTALQSKFATGIACIELDSSPAWRVPSMTLADRYNPGTETSGKTANGLSKNNNTDQYGGPGAGKMWIQTPSVAFRADSVGLRATVFLRWNPQNAVGPFTCYVDIIDVIESANPATAYPLVV